MSYLSKLYKIGEQRVNELFYHPENPIRAFEFEVKNLKIELENAFKATARVKAARIRAEKDIDEYLEKAISFETKVKELLLKAEAGQISSETADKIALQMLAMKRGYEKKSELTRARIPRMDDDILKLEDTIMRLQENIDKYEGELEKFKLRMSVGDIVSKVEQELSYLDDSGIVARLEKLKEKIEEKELENDLLSEYVGDYFEKEEKIEQDIYDELKKLKEK